MIRRWVFVSLLACMATLPGHALATEIVMALTSTVTVTRQSVDVRLVVANTGDEDALVVTPFLAFAGVETGLEAAPGIEYGGERSWVHSFPVDDLLVSETGTYPLVVRLRYHDAYMYPYSMVSVSSVRIGENLPVDVPISGELAAGQVRGEETLDLRLRNTGIAPLEARVTMISPSGLVVTGDTGSLDISAGEEKQISYIIKNNGSLPGSSHNVYALVEYSSDGQHDVLVLEETVAVGSDVSGKKRRIIVASAGLLVLLFFLVLFLELRTGAGAA
jgi:hypothetical protein